MISAVPPKEYGDRFMGVSSLALFSYTQGLTSSLIYFYHQFVYSIIRGNDVSLRPKMWHTPELDGEKGKVKTQ